MSCEYRFSKSSLSRLETCHPDLRILFKSIIKRRDCKILCGVRSKAEQDRLFNLKKSKLMWPHSKHNVEDPDGLAMACDVVPYFSGKDPAVIWPDASANKWTFIKQMGLYYDFHGYVKATADALGISIRWGGDWDGDGDYTDQTFDDLVHFELI